MKKKHLGLVAGALVVVTLPISTAAVNAQTTRTTAPQAIAAVQHSGAELDYARINTRQLQSGVQKAVNFKNKKARSTRAISGDPLGKNELTRMLRAYQKTSAFVQGWRVDRSTVKQCKTPGLFDNLTIRSWVERKKGLSGPLYRAVSEFDVTQLNGVFVGDQAFIQDAGGTMIRFNWKDKRIVKLKDIPAPLTNC